MALTLIVGEILAQTMQHKAALKAAQSSLVTASSDYTARLWDGTTGQAVEEPMQHDSAVTSARAIRELSWCSDGASGALTACRSKVTRACRRES